LNDSPSEEEEEDEAEEEVNEREYDEDETALFIKKLNKFIKKRKPYKGKRKEKPMSKRVCYNYGKNGHFIAQCPYERKKTMTREKSLIKPTRKITNTLRRNLMVKRMLAKNGTQVMRVPN
jgi:hypothetical protein